MFDMSAPSHPQIRINLGYRDAQAAIRFLVDALGFEERVRYQGDSGVIGHAELTWPEGGIVTVHTAEGNSVADLAERTNADGGYPAYSIHIDVDDPDTRYQRAVDAGATVIREVQNSAEGLGVRNFIVSDPEGLYWSFGTPLPDLIADDDGKWRPADE